MLKDKHKEQIKRLPMVINDSEIWYQLLAKSRTIYEMI